MLNRNEKAYPNTLLPRSTNSMSLRTRFAKGDERNLFRKGLTKNLYCSFYQVDELAKKLKRSTNQFIREKKDLKDSIANLKEENKKTNDVIKAYFGPQVKELLRELNDHKKAQADMNRGFEGDMVEESREFDKVQTQIDSLVRSLNQMDEIVGINTNFF